MDDKPEGDHTHNHREAGLCQLLSYTVGFLGWSPAAWYA